MPYDFQPVYIRPWELAGFGLPTMDANANVLNLVREASSAIDTHCQTKDEDGYGSLIYSTYTDRLIIRGSNPNVFRLTHRPLVGIDAGTVAALTASGVANLEGYDNGALASTEPRLNGAPGELCAILTLSGRYGTARNSPTARDFIAPVIQNPSNLAQLFGGPPAWMALEPGMADYNPKNGEVWAPPGILLYRYTEVQITYTAGFDPRNMPRNVKRACANIVKNMLAKPIAGITSANFADSGMSMSYTPSYIDSHTEALLQPFKRVVYG